jgi:hypothetical protein
MKEKIILFHNKRTGVISDGGGDILSRLYFEDFDEYLAWKYVFKAELLSIGATNTTKDGEITSFSVLALKELKKYIDISHYNLVKKNGIDGIKIHDINNEEPYRTKLFVCSERENGKVQECIRGYIKNDRILTIFPYQKNAIAVKETYLSGRNKINEKIY